MGYVARFLGPGEQNVNSLCPNTMVHLARKPVFLSRSVRSYRAKTRHKIVPRPIAKEKEEKKEEPVPVLPLPAAPPNRQGKLNLSDSTIMWEEADTGGCIINNDFKILWVVNSENYIYKKNNGTGGEVSTADKRCFAELLYQKKSEKILADENCFKIVLYRDSANMTVELLDTETESRQGNSEAEEEEDDDEEGKQDQHQLEQY